MNAVSLTTWGHAVDEDIAVVMITAARAAACMKGQLDILKGLMRLSVCKGFSYFFFNQK